MKENILLIILFILTIITFIGDFVFNWNSLIGIFTFDIPFVVIGVIILFTRVKNNEM